MQPDVEVFAQLLLVNLQSVEETEVGSNYWKNDTFVKIVSFSNCDFFLHTFLSLKAFMKACNEAEKPAWNIIYVHISQEGINVE